MAHKQKKMGTLGLVVIFSAGIALSMLMQYAFIFLLVAMLPTIVAFSSDRSPQRSVTQTVGCCNLTGALYYIGQFFVKGASPVDFAHAMMDMHMWFFIYLAATMGWVLILITPPVMYGALIVWYSYLTQKMEAEQKTLVEQWGPEIKRRQ